MIRKGSHGERGGKGLTGVASSPRGIAAPVPLPAGDDNTGKYYKHYKSYYPRLNMGATTHTIEITGDVYQYLLRNVFRFGDDPSAVLRRLLYLPEPPSSLRAAVETPAAEETPTALDTLKSNALVAFLATPHFTTRRTATDRYLGILSRGYQDDPRQFEQVLGLAGRKRRYFARSQNDVHASGRRTHPRSIPASPYWAMTNASTRSKRDTLARVLRILGYTDIAVLAADAALT